MPRAIRLLLSNLLLLAALTLHLDAAAAAAEGDEGWIDLLAEHELAKTWAAPLGDWCRTKEITLDAEQPKRFKFMPGPGPIIVNGTKGNTRNLVTRGRWGDLEVQVEFMIPKGSNSGVKLQGLYEIQILDSFGKAKPEGHDHGGIYPKAELLPRYRYLDKGFPPRVNAAKPPGHWQTLQIVFQAPRFDAEGKKTANARFVKVVMNGELLHENVELAHPTGHAYVRPEVAQGPLLLQADHGPVAFRKVRVRPLMAISDQQGAKP